MANPFWCNERLFASCKDGGLHFVNFWLNARVNGFNIDAQDAFGATPLMYAIKNGYIGIVHRLVEESANIHIQANGGTTALELAAYQGGLRNVQILCAQTPSPNQRNCPSALMMAAKNSHDAITKFLMEQMPPPRIMDIDRLGNTAIDYASGPAKAYLQCLAWTEGYTGVTTFLLEVTSLPSDLARLVAQFVCWH